MAKVDETTEVVEKEEKVEVKKDKKDKKEIRKQAKEIKKAAKESKKKTKENEKLKKLDRLIDLKQKSDNGHSFLVLKYSNKCLTIPLTNFIKYVKL